MAADGRASGDALRLATPGLLFVTTCPGDTPLAQLFHRRTKPTSPGLRTQARRAVAGLPVGT